jgi:hypothetical protein
MAQAQRADENTGQQPSTRRPETTVRVGNVEIAIWKNQGQNGEFYTASVPTIRYKDGKDDQWKDGSSYGALDLLALAEAAREASAEIRERSKGARKSA